MRRLGFAALLCSLLVAVLLALASLPLVAQADSTADKLGLLGPVVDHFWPVIVTFLTSLVVKGLSLANQAFAKTGEPVKWAVLYGFALLFNLFARWVGITDQLDPLAPAFGLSLVQTGAAALIYKFGAHRVPTPR